MYVGFYGDERTTVDSRWGCKSTYDYGNQTTGDISAAMVDTLSAKKRWRFHMCENRKLNVVFPNMSIKLVNPFTEEQCYER